MEDLLIYGAGGFGREIASLVVTRINKESHQWNLLGFLDDNNDLKGKHNEYGEILGGVDVLNAWKTPVNVFIAIGSGKIVRKIVEKINNPQVKYPNLLYHVTYSDPDNMKIGKGNIVTGAHFSIAVSVGDFNMLNGDVVFGHDVQVGDYNTFMPGVRISGEVKIGQECFFGVGSIVLQQLRVGNHVTLGAGSVMMTKPKDGNLYIGVPARLFKY